jgi:hypothetical protein
MRKLTILGAAACCRLKAQASLRTPKILRATGNISGNLGGWAVVFIDIHVKDWHFGGIHYFQ